MDFSHTYVKISFSIKGCNLHGFTIFLIKKFKINIFKQRELHQPLDSCSKIFPM